MKAAITKSAFLIAVIAEIMRIKRLATKKEIANLNFSRFQHWHSSNCIYGQMTGECSSPRARRIMPKTFEDIVGDWCSGAGGSHKYGFERQKFEKGKTFTALEKYLYMCPKTTHKHIIDFLKGKEKKLVIK